MRSPRPIWKAFIAILCLFSLETAGQTKLDSLLNVLKTQSRDTNRVYTISKICYYYSDDTATYLNYCREIISISEELKFRKGVGEAYALMGRLYLFGYYDPAKASFFYTEALKIQSEVGDKAGMALCYNQLSYLDMDFEDYDHAIENARKAIRLNLETGNQRQLGSNYASLAQAYEKLKSYDSALYYSRSAIQIWLAIHLSPHILYHNMAALFLDIGLYDSCEFYLSLSDSYYRSINNTYGLKWNQATRCDLLIAQGKAAEAVPALEKIYAFADSVNDTELSFAVMPVLLHAYRDLKEYNKGFLLQEKWIRLNDSTRNASNAKRVLGLQMQLEADANARLDSLAQVQREMNASVVLEKEQMFRNGAVIAFLLMLFIAFIILRGFLQKKKSNLIITEQKNLVEEKQKEIVDSITYARRLQEAILPPENLLKEAIPESFVLYMPKDIVAGDFYWMETMGDEILFAVADCTGHGVPGAMVSVVCSNAMNRAVKEFGITGTGKILDKVRDLVLETFGKSSQEVQDGMDISLARISRVNKHLQWSGANNPLWIFTNGNFTEIKADKQPVGKYDSAFPFSTHDIDVTSGTTIYLFTDGYADQFGGEKGKKFRYKQLQELLAANQGNSMSEQRNILHVKMNAWKGDLEQIDDICIAGIRWS